MIKDEFRALLKTAKDMDETQIDLFAAYSELLKEWNQKFNLTAIEDDRDIVIKHFIDSMTILPYIKSNAKLIDIGTGAGFPGIPAKIMRDDIEVDLLDSLEKRVNFLNEVISKLKLGKIRAFHGRAEDYGRNPEFRGKYDIAVARAVASLPVLAEYCLPFVKTGGIFIAMKTENQAEIESSQKAIEVLGGALENTVELTLPDTEIKRTLIIIKKIKPTPERFPRKAGKPSKEPISG